MESNGGVYILPSRVYEFDFGNVYSSVSVRLNQYVGAVRSFVFAFPYIMALLWKALT